jgi:phage terminase large subunit-like protein
MGRPWATPLIQITATSEDQTDNTYDALRPMIELGPLADLIPKTGEEFIRLPGGGRIDAVTSAATSRLGQRTTFAVQDETGLWLETNGGWKLSKTQRRGLAGMGGRSIETTNSWNPTENSVAQRTFESKAADINKDFQQPPADLDFKNKADRRRIFEINYAAAPWVSIDAVEAEAAELMETDPADAERFFGNRIVAGSGAWLDITKWDGKAVPPAVVQARTKVCLGFDGSDNNDHTGIRLETLQQYQFTPTYGVNETKTLWDPRDWGGRVPRSEVNAAVDELASRFEIVRAYLDPQFWETEIDAWAARYGEKVFIKWPTNRVSQMWASLERFKTDVGNSESVFTHDGDPQVQTHIRNAVVRSRAVNSLTKERQYIIGKPEDHQKIDYAMSSVLAHDAVMDAIAGGALEESPDEYVYF